MNYWEECIRETFDDIKIQASEEQMKYIIEAVQGAYDNYYTFGGDDTALMNSPSEAEIELQRIKEEREIRKNWINSTTACVSCTTTGVVDDGWGRDRICPKCDGDGRHL